MEDCLLTLKLQKKLLQFNMPQNIKDTFMCPFFMPKLFLLLLLLCVSEIAGATIYFELNREVVASYQQGISLNYSGFVRAQDELKKKQPTNGLVLLLDNYKDLIRLLIDEDQNDYRLALSNRNKRIRNLELANQNSPFYYYCLTECYLHWAIIRIRYNDHVRGANDLRKAALYLSKGQSRFPQFYMFLKPAALISSMAASVPENYKWLSNLAGISGTIKDANQKLNTLIGQIHASKTFDFIENEIQFIQIFIDQNLMQSDQTPLILQETQLSPLLKFAQVWQASKKQQSKLVLEEIPALKEHIKGLEFCYLDYLRAEAELNLLLNPSKSLNAFLYCTKGQTFIKAAHRKLAWYHLIHFDTTSYFSELKILKGVGSSYSDDDKQALEEAMSNKLPNVALLKSRLLFDGGQFQESLSVLNANQTEFISPADRCEYYYRKARSLQRLGDSQKAKANFKNAIIIGEKLPLYFAASSSYQLAIILLSENDREGAKAYFKKVSTFPYHAYKTSLDMKAAAQLSNSY